LTPCGAEHPLPYGERSAAVSGAGSGGRAFWREGDGYNISLDRPKGVFYDHPHGRDRRARIVDRIGCFYESFTTFTLPDDQTISSKGAEMILLEQTRPMRHCLKSQDSLDESKRNIGRYCSGNTRLLFAISCAEAAPSESKNDGA
jgi:hypothetical protein